MTQPNHIFSRSHRSSCGRRSSIGQRQRKRNRHPITIRIGYQKSSTLTAILKTNGDLEKALAPLGVRVSWHEFTSGLPLLEAINTGNIDFGADVADTVPLFAQAAGAKLAYIAEEAASPSAQAILVGAESPIRTLTDLKGKKIAVTKGAGSHFLLLAALAKSGLEFQGYRAGLSDAGGRPRRLHRRQCRRLGRLGSVPDQRPAAIRCAHPGRRQQRPRQLQAILSVVGGLRRPARRRSQRHLRQARRNRQMGEGASEGSGQPRWPASGVSMPRRWKKPIAIAPTASE